MKTIILRKKKCLPSSQNVAREMMGDVPLSSAANEKIDRDFTPLFRDNLTTNESAIAASILKNCYQSIEYNSIPSGGILFQLPPEVDLQTSNSNTNTPHRWIAQSDSFNPVHQNVGFERINSKLRRQPRSKYLLTQNHRDNERYRHHGLNATINEITRRIPQGKFDPKCRRTKILKLQQIIDYICHLESSVRGLCLELGVDFDTRLFLTNTQSSAISKCNRSNFKGKNKQTDVFQKHSLDNKLESKSMNVQEAGSEEVLLDDVECDEEVHSVAFHRDDEEVHSVAFHRDGTTELEKYPNVVISRTSSVDDDSVSRHTYEDKRAAQDVQEAVEWEFVFNDKQESWYLAENNSGGQDIGHINTEDGICEDQSEIETFDELDKNSLITWEKYLDITSTVACGIGTTVEDEMFEILRRSPLPILSNDAVDDFSDIILSQDLATHQLIHIEPDDFAVQDENEISLCETLEIDDLQFSFADDNQDSLCWDFVNEYNSF